MGKRQKIAFNENSEVVFLTIDTNTNETIETKTPLEMGLWKSREFYYIFKRCALNPVSLQNIEGFFIQKVLFRCPNKDGLEFHYFYFEKGFSLPCCRILDPRLNNLCGLTFQVSTNDPTFTKNIGKPKRLSNTIVKKAIIDKKYNGIDVLGCYSEDGSERV